MPQLDAASNESYALTPEQLQKVIATIDIPACPAIVVQALTEAQKDDPDLTTLGRLIAGDPSMSATALKLANSVVFRAGTPTSSVPQAINRLGTNTIVCIVIAAALRTTVTGISAEWLDRFWQRVTLIAEVSALIARRQFGISPDAAYTYALFHDAAIPIMMKRFENYGEVLSKAEQLGQPLVEAEGSYFPSTHPVIGALLARNWGFPPVLGLAIRFHHEADAYETSDKTLPAAALSFIAITQIAESMICEASGDPSIEVTPALFGKAVSFLGINDDELDDLRARVSALISG